MKNWYANNTALQKGFMFVIAIVLAAFSLAGTESIPLFAIGMLPLVLLVYLALGKGKKKALHDL